MSQKKKGTSSARQPLKPTTAKVTSTPVVVPDLKEDKVLKEPDIAHTLVFDRENFKWIFIGLGVIILGLILMAGGSMPDPNTWDPSLIYGFRRITLAPIVILIGLGIEIYAIFRSSGGKSSRA